MKASIRIGIICFTFGTYGTLLLSQPNLRNVNVPEVVRIVRDIAQELRANFPTRPTRANLRNFVNNALINIPTRLFGVDVAHLRDLPPEARGNAVALIRDNIAEVQRILRDSIADQHHRLTLAPDDTGGLHQYILTGLGNAQERRLIPHQLGNFYAALRGFVADRQADINQLGIDTVAILRIIQETLIPLTHQRSRRNIFRAARMRGNALRVAEAAIENDIINVMNTIVRRVEVAVQRYYEPFINSHPIGLVVLAGELFRAPINEIDMREVEQNFRRVAAEVVGEDELEEMRRRLREGEEEQE